MKKLCITPPLEKRGHRSDLKSTDHGRARNESGVVRLPVQCSSAHTSEPLFPCYVHVESITANQKLVTKHFLISLRTSRMTNHPSLPGFGVGDSWYTRFFSVLNQGQSQADWDKLVPLLSCVHVTDTQSWALDF